MECSINKSVPSNAGVSTAPHFTNILNKIHILAITRAFFVHGSLRVPSTNLCLISSAFVLALANRPVGRHPVGRDAVATKALRLVLQARVVEPGGVAVGNASVHRHVGVVLRRSIQRPALAGGILDAAHVPPLQRRRHVGKGQDGRPNRLHGAAVGLVHGRLGAGLDGVAAGKRAQDAVGHVLVDPGQ